jgi:tetratricopeptide (TPR) repeat protein
MVLGMVWREMNHDRYAGDGPPSTNEAANALCAKALLVLRGDNYAAFPEAYTNLHRAIELDPHFARPYVGLFELRSRESVPSLPATSPEEIHSIARTLEELAPDLGVTHCALALVNFYDWDYPKALEHARQSVKADPNYEFGHVWYGYMLAHWGRPLEARRQIEIARRIAPSKATVYRALGHTY